ncbi:ABC transporter substrate-binding protein [Phyllobacterium sp. 21LDTY02-6]|jgi:peptide/nickel transport system substrate-binding protein|uniref:ABC transporter substrate-binding protein n=1 Tax=unclassified Phyllobacterium TaxID=2638441 RepID=UPI002021FC2E|nr:MULTISPECIES: ABC transporter substrate-binding protein [unclassified Phyllobacterium]MCO4316987.1 ABC transporter substrate-binding protein [Phyllobacterium sp. 21LDTY02-6]MCX8282397.1 ABC transporter substrate-binding protein [Phyllobacterium sp. 0TCS1.6C]MCX8295250.1 ABC transporter substrate-binding protein [Phyllobacterium sp. 0TCS1.6A]
MFMQRINPKFRLMLSGAALSALVFSSIPALAETPPDTLVEAFAIDDVITLDPAEAFELTMGEINGNTYDKLVRLDVNDPSKIVADLAESWTVSDDGLTYTFKLKQGLKFASGNPLTAEDVAYSFERAIKLDKSPAFILTQFGLKPDNVAEKAKATDPSTFVFTVDQAYAPSFVLNCLTSTVASVVDKKLILEHVVNDDFGNAWMKTAYAGSGPMKIRDWRANEIIVLERNDNYYGEKAPLTRVIYRHVKESAAQRLLLEKGDIDIARNLEPNDLEQVTKNSDITTVSAPKGTIYYFSLNQKNENLAKPEVRQALKYLVDYDAIGEKLIKGIGEIHQTFLPKNILGQLDEKPFKLDVAKAKELLEKAGLKDGFTVTMDVRNNQPVTGIAESVQQSFAQAGVKLEIIPGDGKQTLTKFRARTHDMYIGQWGVDYWDPHSNAETFTSNPDNADTGTNKTLAWRNAWDVPELTKETRQALLERDPEKRATMYQDLQRKVLETSPFVMLFQQIEVAGVRANVKNLKLGPSFDTNYVFNVSK